MTLAAQIAEVATNTELVDIPDAVRQRISIHILDTVGVSIAAAVAPWNKPVFEHVVATSSAGASSSCFHAQPIDAGSAALGNATAAHGAELDDFHVPGGVHAGAVIVPVAIAVSEEVDTDLERLVLAATLGYETVIRVGLAMSPQMTGDRGFHVTSVFGPIGAAVTAGILRGLTSDQLAHAIGIAVASCGGVTEYTRTGGEIKRFHAGLAARAGVDASSLASHGLTAPAESLEGERGYFRAFAGSRLDLTTFEGFGEVWSSDGLGIKPWSTCAGNQPAIAALEKLLQDGLRPDEIAEIEVWADQTAVGHCGFVGVDPRDMTGLQFSMHTALALRAVHRSNALSTYLGALDGSDRDAVVAMASRVRVHVGHEEEASFTTRPFATVRVTRVDGTTTSARGTTPGDPSSALDLIDLRAKLRESAQISPHAYDFVASDLLQLTGSARTWSPYGRLSPR